MRVPLFVFGSSHIIETELGTSEIADQYFASFFSTNLFIGCSIIDLFFDEQDSFFPCYEAGEVDIRLSPVVDHIIEPWTSSVIVVLVFSPHPNNLARVLFQ